MAKIDRSSKNGNKPPTLFIIFVLIWNPVLFLILESVTGRTVVMVMRIIAKLAVKKKGANKVENFDL